MLRPDHEDPDYIEMFTALSHYLEYNPCDLDISELEMRFWFDEAIWWFAHEWHEGPGSNLYTAMNEMGYRPEPGQREPIDIEFYQALLDAFVEEADDYDGSK